MTVIAVEQLHKRYGERVAIEDISFGVEQGEIFGIVGPNGAGKTTTVECVAGLRYPDRGTLRVLGRDPRRDRAALRRRVGVQLQACTLPGKLKVWEALTLYGSFYERPAPWPKLLDELGLAAQRNARFEQLSGGQRQRLSIALALVGQPELVILDELSTGLDPQARRDTWELVSGLRARGVTVLLVTHFMAEVAELCDRVAIIDRGRVVALDRPAALVAGLGAEQRLRFRPSAPLDPALLRELPEVHAVEVRGAELRVSGTGNLAGAVLGLLARRNIVAADLRVEQATLDDAFTALTGRAADAAPAYRSLP